MHAEIGSPPWPLIKETGLVFRGACDGCSGGSAGPPLAAIFGGGAFLLLVAGVIVYANKQGNAKTKRDNKVAADATATPADPNTSASKPGATGDGNDKGATWNDPVEPVSTMEA